MHVNVKKQEVHFALGHIALYIIVDYKKQLQANFAIKNYKKL